jgi:hypothetical protein
MKNIASALVKAQQAFGPALKTNTNPHFRSKYADLSACVEAVIDALNANGIALVQQTHECENGVIVETLFVHESGETFSGGKLHVPAPKHDPQGYGSALSYARRYSLMAACGIAPEDDDGNAASKKPANVIPASFRSSPLVDEDGRKAIELLPEDQQEYLRDLAMVVASLIAEQGAAAAVAKIEAENLDNEQRMGLWSILDSKTRSAIKRAKQPAKEAA